MDEETAATAAAACDLSNGDNNAAAGAEDGVGSPFPPPPPPPPPPPQEQEDGTTAGAARRGRRDRDGQTPPTGSSSGWKRLVAVAFSAARTVLSSAVAAVVAALGAAGAVLASLRTVLTFSNAATLVFLWQFLLKPSAKSPAGSGGFGSSSLSSSSLGKIQQFELKQHFVFGPVGYAPYPPAAPVVPAGSATAGSPPASAAESARLGGYFAMDMAALAGYLRAPAAAPPLPDRGSQRAREEGAEEGGAGTTAAVATAAALPPAAAKEEPRCKDDELAQRCEEVALAEEPARPPPSKPVPSESPPAAASASPPVVVLDLNLNEDPRGEIKFIRDAVTFLIGFYHDYARTSSGNGNGNGNASQASADGIPVLRKPLEVVVLLESSGGSIHAYGLIAEQLKRLRSVPGIALTVTCDLVAASGGYMVASTASPGRLLASPFALIGSIGVTAPAAVNVREALEDHGVRTIHVKSGARKRASGDLLFGKVSDEDLQGLQENMDRAHAAFRDHVMELRGDKISPGDYDAAMSGDDWIGRDALKLGLVDRLVTSDEYLNEKLREGSRVIHLLKNTKGRSDDKSWWLRILDMLVGDGDAGASTGHGKAVLAPRAAEIHALLEVAARLLAERLAAQ
jgi:serine protease SohB